MSSKKQKHSNANSSILDRKHYNQEENYDWLPVLLDSYAICDEEMANDIVQEQKRRGLRVACHKGCHACCLKPDVPVSELEVRGISFYVSEIMDFEDQQKLVPRLRNQKNTLECPFLINRICSIYPVRPLACRGFVVYRTPCAIGEDLVKTRPADVHPPSTKMGKRVAMRFFESDIYNLTTVEDKTKAFEEGIIPKTSRPMHDLPGTRLIDAISLYANKRFNKELEL